MSDRERHHFCLSKPLYRLGEYRQHLSLRPDPSFGAPGGLSMAVLSG